MTFAAGYIAGVFCAIVSHPADTIVSKLNQSKGSSAAAVAKELGFMGQYGGCAASLFIVYVILFERNLSRHDCLDFKERDSFDKTYYYFYKNKTIWQ